MMFHPAQGSQGSRQDVGTPDEFLRAVIARFGPLDFDLAAHSANAVCLRFYSPDEDSLAQDWTTLGGNLWLNPPFGRIAPFFRKCKLSAGEGRRIIALVPASVGARWFIEYAFDYAAVYFLNPRIKFIGYDGGFPKDCMLCVWDYTPKDGWKKGIEVWEW